MSTRIKDLATGTPTGAEFFPFDSASGGTRKRAVADILKDVPTVTIGDGTGVVTLKGDGDDSVRVLGGLGVTGNAYVTGVLQVNVELDAETLVVNDTADVQGDLSVTGNVGVSGLASAASLWAGAGGGLLAATVGDGLVIGRTSIRALAPSQITSDQTDYAPAGIDDVSCLRLSCDADGRAIRSMGSVTAWHRLMLIRNGGTKRLVLKHNYTSGTTVGYRFKLPRDRDLVLLPDQSVLLARDVDDTKWVALAPPTTQPKQITAPITASAYTILPGDDVILVDTTSNAVALTRPAFDGLERVIIKVAGGTNGITLVRLGSEKINGVAATYTLPGSATAWASATPQGWMFVDDGTDTQVC